MVKWTGEMVKEFVEDEGYELVSVPNWDWVKAKDRIWVSCGEHDSYRVTWNKFQNNRRCPRCSGNHKYNHNEICEEIKKLDENYFVCEDSPVYEGCFTKLKLSCGEHEIMMCWADYMSGRRCPKCSKYRNRYNHDEICKEIQKLDSEYSVCDDSPKYENAHIKLKLYHSICENEFYVTWAKFSQGSRPCGCYTFSKNEVLIRKYLKSKNIEFSEQITFDGLKLKSKFRYDFGIYEEDKLLFLIEYDGKQHFEPATFGGISQEQAEENLIKTQHHDKLKNNYAKENNISLLRIRYDEDTIFVLENYLKGLQLIKEDDIINLTKKE